MLERRVDRVPFQLAPSQSRSHTFSCSFSTSAVSADALKNVWTAHTGTQTFTLQPLLQLPWKLPLDFKQNFPRHQRYPYSTLSTAPLPSSLSALCLLSISLFFLPILKKYLSITQKNKFDKLFPFSPFLLKCRRTTYFVCFSFSYTFTFVAPLSRFSSLFSIVKSKPVIFPCYFAIYFRSHCPWLQFFHSLSPSPYRLGVAEVEVQRLKGSVCLSVQFSTEGMKNRR